MDRRAFLIALTSTCAVAGSALGQPAASPGTQTRPRWGQQAEKEFRIGRGLAPRLMTEEEWKEHQQKMQQMTAEERERYRQEVHQRMMERARERGITVPPGPRGPAGGPRRPGS